MGAKRGGGPKTAAGKAVVRLNPMRHGVLSQTPVIPLVEREEDWEKLRRGIFDQLGVKGTLEESLAERIASLIWRLHRVVRFESESIVGYLDDVPGDWREMRGWAGEPTKVTEEAVREMDKMLMARLLPGDESLDKIMRYETRLHRFLLQTLHQLLILKGLRKHGSRYYGLPDLDPPGFLTMRGPREVPATLLGAPAESDESGATGGSVDEPAAE